MMVTTVLAADKYNISTIQGIRVADLNTFSPLNTLEMIRESAIGYSRLEFLTINDIIASTYGKYSREGVNFTQAVLEEHKVERDRDH